MRTVNLQKNIVYGPVASRRFGKSLGINLLPVDCKVCSFSCVYCQYADCKSSQAKFPTFDEVSAVVGSEFQRIDRENLKINWIMLSGNGEPTLHPDFSKLVETIISLRNLHLPGIPIGILSNSSTCAKEDIRVALSMLDGRFMKLDAGSLYVFHVVNRPVSTLIFGDVMEGLCNLPDVTIQSMFVTGEADNTGERVVNDWIQAVRCIKPIEVQIYTVERTPQEIGILPVDEEKLKIISKELTMKTQIKSTVYCQGADL